MRSKDFNFDLICNDGERLIPFLSHDTSEAARHMSSHNFFRNIIKKDIQLAKLSKVDILDLGFGTGYGSYMYSKINEVDKIIAIDVSDELLEWAK